MYRQEFLMFRHKLIVDQIIETRQIVNNSELKYEQKTAKSLKSNKPFTATMAGALGERELLLLLMFFAAVHGRERLERKPKRVKK